MSYPPPGGPPPAQPGWVPPIAPPSYGTPGYGTPGYGTPGYLAPIRIQGLASYGKRVVGHLLDNLVVWAFLVVGLVVILTGETEIVVCSDGTGLCEEPTDATFLAGFAVMALAIPTWIAYHVWEGVTGKTLGKLVMGIRLVDQRTMEPVGGWKGLGRGLVEALLGSITCIGSIVDLLWPMWDDDNQTVHDKAVSSVVVEAAHLRPRGTTPTPAFRTHASYAATGPPPAPYYGAPPPPPPPPPYGSPPTAPPTAPPPGAPGSPTDPFGNPTSAPPGY